MKRISVIVALMILTGCGMNAEPYGWTEHNLIAHAAGGIDKKSYTNSIEAFNHNYEKGHRLFEIDISITSDDKLVARHGWEDDLGQNLNNNKQPLSYKEYMKTTYHNKYHPMDFDDVLNLLEKHDDIYIILDGKVESPKDVEILYEKIGEATKNLKPKYKERLIPQMFYKADLEVIRDKGFHDIVYVVGREEFNPESLAKYCEDNDIGVVSLSRSRTSKKLVEKLSEKEIVTYMYTLNDQKEMNKYLDMGVHGFFTDFVDELNK